VLQTRERLPAGGVTPTQATQPGVLDDADRPA